MSEAPGPLATLKPGGARSRLAPPSARLGFGDSGTRLGFGASGPWAMPWFSETKAERVLVAALAAGLRDFDTGPSYARGNAEPRLGRLLANLVESDSAPAGCAVPDRLRLSSKVGTQVGKRGRLVKDFRPEAIHRQAEATLGLLGVPSLDVLYLHGPDEHALSPALVVLNKLKHLGRIRAIGVCTDHRYVSLAAAAPEVDWIMAPYNVLDQRAHRALQTAKANGKKIAVVAPLAQALWRRDFLAPTSPARAWYAARAFARNRAGWRAARQARWLRDVEGWSPAALALAFVRKTLAPDLIYTTSTNPDHVRASAEAMTRPVPADLAARFGALLTA